MLADDSGLNTTAVDFPAGTDVSFAFAPDEKLSVYTGDVVLHAHLTATRGSHLLQGALRFQACNVNACFPPKKIPVACEPAREIGAAGRSHVFWRRPVK